jgi:hypothetical protein
VEASSAEAPAEEAGQAQGLGSRLLDLGFSALPAIGGAVGFLGFVAVIGGAIQWVRFSAAQLPAAQAIHAMPRGELVAIGAQYLILFTLLGLVAALVVYVVDPRGEGTPGTVRALVFVTALECIAVLGLIKDPGESTVGSIILVAVEALLVGLIVGPVWRSLKLVTGGRQLRSARRRWDEAAAALRLERSLASPDQLGQMTPEEAAAATARLGAAERRLIEAEAEWDRLVTDLKRLTPG